MVMEAEKALREVVQGLPQGHPDFAFLSEQLHVIEVRAQFSYLEFDKFPTTEAEVKAELARQADRYLEFGLNKHPGIKMTPGNFKDSLIALARPQSESFADRSPLPVAVLGQVPARDVYAAAGVKYWIEGLNVRDWPDDPKGYKTPSTFYLSWMQDGSANLKRKVEDVRLSLDTDMRGATEIDGSGLYVAHPRVLEHHVIDLPGTSVESAYAPYLYLLRAWPGVDCNWVGDAHPGFGSALCGRD